MAIDREQELRQSLEWALDALASYGCVDDGTPNHLCDFQYRPDKGYCRFHDEFWTAADRADVLDSFATEHTPTESASPNMGTTHDPDETDDTP